MASEPEWPQNLVAKLLMQGARKAEPAYQRNS